MRWSVKRRSGPSSSKVNRTRTCGESGARRPDQQLTAHAEVREQRVVPDRQPQVLAPAPGAVDGPAGQPGDEVRRAGLVPPDGARMQDLDVSMRAADDELLESAPDRLDLGQFGHATSSARATGRPARPLPLPACCSVGHRHASATGLDRAADSASLPLGETFADRVPGCLGRLLLGFLLGPALALAVGLRRRSARTRGTTSGGRGRSPRRGTRARRASRRRSVPAARSSSPGPRPAWRDLAMTASNSRCTSASAATRPWSR